MGSIIERARTIFEGNNPESVEEYPQKYRQLAIDYQVLKVTHDRVHDELNEAQLAAQDNLLGDMGSRVKHRALRFTDEVMRIAEIPPMYEDKKYLEIGDLYWFAIIDQRLVIKKIKSNMLRQDRPDLENAKEAPDQAWFSHGLEVADKLIDYLTRNRRLPGYLKNIPLPA